MAGRRVLAAVSASVFACLLVSCTTAGEDSGAAPQAASEAPAGPLAFPGALGWAAQTPGGRGGEIIRVTNLNPLPRPISL